MSEWKTIDSAPKDGTFVILAIPGWELPACCAVASWQGRGDEANWYGMFDSGLTFDARIYDIEEQPTHWMPLPSPPEPVNE